MKFKVNLKSPAIPFPHKRERIINSCHANLVLRDDILRHYEMAHKELGFEMIRFHGILSDQIGIYQKTGSGYYLAQYSIDKNNGSVYEFWQRQGSPAGIIEKDLSKYVKKAYLKVNTDNRYLKPIKGEYLIETTLPPAGVKLYIVKKR